MVMIRGNESAAGDLLSRAKALLLRIVMRMQGYVLRASRGTLVHALPVALTPESLRTTRHRSIIVIRVDEIGDVTLTSAFLGGVRRLFPDARITLLVKEEVKDLVLYCPHTDEILSLRNTCGKLKRWFILPWEMRAYARTHLQQRAFDMAILPRWDVDAHYAGVLAYHAGIPVRIGFAEHVHPRKTVLNAGFDRFFTHTVYDDAPRHEVERGTVLLRQMGGEGIQEPPGLWVTREDEAAVASILASVGVPSRARVVAIAPGAGRPRREWPAASFAEIGRRVVESSPDTFVIVVGGPHDERVAQEVADAIGPRARSVAGRTTLRQTGALFKRSALFIGNDSGPAHMAAAAGIPLVVISCHPRDGAAMDVQSPRRFGPWSPTARVLQPERGTGGCVESCCATTAHCILQVSVDDVLKSVMDAAGSRLAAPPAGDRADVSEVHRT